MSERLPFRFRNEYGPAISPVVELGDQDVAANVSRVQFDCGVGDIPTVVLTMPLSRGATLDLRGAIVELSPENRDLLVQLGWSPPVDIEAEKAASTEAILAAGLTPEEAVAIVEANPPDGRPDDADA